MQFGIEAVAAAASQVFDVAAPGKETSSRSFAAMMQAGMGDLNSNVSAAEAAVSDLAAGKPVELHDVMISLEQARISVQTFVQIRNKLIESYQDLMRMQL